MKIFSCNCLTCNAYLTHLVSRLSPVIDSVFYRLDASLTGDRKPKTQIWYKLKTLYYFKKLVEMYLKFT